MRGIESKTPNRVLKYWPYSVAYVKAPLNREYILGEWNSKNEKDERERCDDLRVKLADLYYKHAMQQVASGDSIKKYPGISFYLDKFHFNPDNKEVYLYVTDDGQEVAVCFKDGRTIFGRREDIESFDTPCVKLMPESDAP